MEQSNTYNLSTLISRVKTRLKDADYDDATITEFLNDTMFEILGQDRFPFLEGYWETTTTRGGELPLPPNFQSTLRLTAEDEHGIQPLKYVAARWYFSMPKKALRPYEYTVFAGKTFYELPPKDLPTQAGQCPNVYKLRHYYLAKPVAMVNDTDTTPIPYEYNEVLVLGALARAERLRDNFDYAQIYENKRDELLTAMAMRYGPRQLDDGNRAVLPVRVWLRNS